ncbi:YciI family protein [Gemmata sp.]|uniref:YciI family protein n=1 Tax=Gemmata sp. TaxID=1914242 RepID=UPI003F724414
MRYLFLMYGAESNWTDAERRECVLESLAVCDDLAAQGKLVATAPLHPVATAATVRVRDGRPLVTDGPFAETIEQLGGYFLLDLADLDEAIAVAARLPPVAKGAAEIRPVLCVDGLPPERIAPFAAPGAGGTPYMLLCYDDEGAWERAGDAARRDALSAAVGLCHRLSADGRYALASPLHPAATATCVRVRNGVRHVTDGPFAETHEVLGGFYVVRAESRAAALAIAAEHPGAARGSVEVRALVDLSGLRNSQPAA